MSGGEASVLTFEEIAVGRTARLDASLTPAAIDAFAKLTGDVNPLHVDAAFARAKGQPDRLAHGLLTAAFFSTICGMLLPGRDCLLQSVKFDFRKPVPAGTKLVLEAVVVQKIEAVRALVLDVTAKDAAGTVYVTGKIQAGVT